MTHPTTIPDLLAQGSDADIAIAAPGQPPLSYRDLRRATREWARVLAVAGIGRGGRVGIVVENGPLAATLFLGAATAGIACPLNPAFTEDEFHFALADLGASVLIVGGPTAAAAAAEKLAIPILEAEAGTGGIAPRFSAPTADAANKVAAAADEALALHTSGTTARPKLVPLSHRNLCASARNIAGTLELTALDRCLNVMPLFHVHGIVAALLSSLYVGGTVWCAPGFNGLKFFGWLAQAEASWMTAVPTIYQAILARADRNADILAAHSMRFLLSSSAAMPSSVLEQLEHAFRVPVVESYGMTEAAQQICANPLPPAIRKPGTAGRPSGPEVAILDEGGARMSPRVSGEVAVRGDNVMAGYFENAAANAQAFTDGWLRTGDLGRFDEDGYLTLEGRIKEIINRGGEKISPFEVENALLRHPDVQEAAVFALHHPSLGEEAAAALVLGDGIAAEVDGIRAFVAGRIAGFKVPRTMVIVDELPKGPTGKVARTGLARRLGLAPSTGGEKR